MLREQRKERKLCLMAWGYNYITFVCVCVCVSVNPFELSVRIFVSVFFPLLGIKPVVSRKEEYKCQAKTRLPRLGHDTFVSVLFGVLAVQSVSFAPTSDRRYTTRPHRALMKRPSTTGLMLRFQEGCACVCVYVCLCSLARNAHGRSGLKPRCRGKGAAMLTQPHLLDPSLKCNAF